MYVIYLILYRFFIFIFRLRVVRSFERRTNPNVLMWKTYMNEIRTMTQWHQYMSIPLKNKMKFSLNGSAKMGENRKSDSFFLWTQEFNCLINFLWILFLLSLIIKLFSFQSNAVTGAVACNSYVKTDFHCSAFACGFGLTIFGVKIHLFVFLFLTIVIKFNTNSLKITMKFRFWLVLDRR